MAKSFEYNPNDPRTFEEQRAEWLLVADTRELTIESYPGRGEEQRMQTKPVVVTKQGRRQ